VATRALVALRTEISSVRPDQPPSTPEYDRLIEAGNRQMPSSSAAKNTM
jgi:hypothetical protein